MQIAMSSQNQNWARMVVFPARVTDDLIRTLFRVGEPIAEPDVDLSAFLEKQRLSPQPLAARPPHEEADVIDESLANAYIPQRKDAIANMRKGKVQQVEWDDSLEALSREKAAADATRGMDVIVPQCDTSPDTSQI